MFSFEQMKENTWQMKQYAKATKTILPQTWPQEKETVANNNFFKLFSFTPDRHTSKNIVLVNPPRAGHHSNIAFRVIQFYIDNTDYDVFGMEHLAATEETKDYGFDQLVRQVHQAHFIIKLINRATMKIHLVGLCQGGGSSFDYLCRTES